mmetsp:Transcript_75413/g.152507  ORF Transcript_75413/g.152507 Transcript_75413/m.152507 type:complete len:222 (+) Transcript_75413:1363-2028(+)
MPTTKELIAAALAWIDLHSTLTRNAQSSRAFDNMPGVFSGLSWNPTSWRNMEVRMVTRKRCVMASPRMLKQPCEMVLPISTLTPMITKMIAINSNSLFISSLLGRKKASIDPTNATVQTGIAEPSISAPRMAGMKKGHSGLLKLNSRPMGTLYSLSIFFSRSSCSFFSLVTRCVSDSALSVDCRRVSTAAVWSWGRVAALITASSSSSSCFWDDSWAATRA